MDPHRAYWTARLEREWPRLTIPTDRPRPPVSSYVRERTVARVDAETWTAFRTGIGGAEPSTFGAGAAVLAVLLHRYTGQEELTVAMIAANTVTGDPTAWPLHTSVAAGTEAGIALREATSDAEEMLTHRESDLEAMTGELPAARQFEWPDVTPVAVIAGIDGEPPSDPDDVATGFDLVWRWSADADGAVIELEYDAEVFEPDGAESFVRQVVELIRAVATDPTRPVGALPMVSADERQALIDRWFAAPVDEPPDDCLHLRFERRAREQPDAVAVSSGDRRVTYHDLNARANRLARRLRAGGVAPDALVGLFVDQSVEAVVGILGILKAGGAFLPLDPAHPPDRITYMVTDAGASLVVTREALRDRMPDGAWEIVSIDGDDAAIPSPSPTDPPAVNDGSDLAYVIYTSGSTGRPKGVMVEHANVVRLFDATDEWFGFGPSDVWTLFHSCAFDFSVWEIWGALLYGGRLVVVPYLVTRSPDLFVDLVRREGVTVLNQTPSAFKQLAKVEEIDPLPVEGPLRYVIFGGEALDPGSLAAWVGRHGTDRPRLVNMYGITETTVHVTYRPLSAGDVRAGSRSPIGVPIPDLRLAILDEAMQPVPPGVRGELYVGGAGVARGYLHRDELTAQRFVRNPFGSGRLYRTGDVGRMRADGDVEYLGRADDQLKIRGFRIEPGEIEAVLAGHPEVSECVVVARDGRLVAYVVDRGTPPTSADRLRETLRARLPEYMVPAAFVNLDRLPLTPNGKIDRQRLPAPDPDASPKAKTPIAPANNERERIIARVWHDLLRTRAPGLDDNFFELGGDSVTAVDAVDRLRETLHVDLSVVHLFQYPTVRALAAHLDAGDAAAASFDDADDRARRQRESRARRARRGA